MNKKVSLALTLLLSLSLSACGTAGTTGTPDPQDNPQQQQSSVQQTPQPKTEQKLSAKDVGREETKNITIYVEGLPEEIPSTLHIGEGYSMYIPTDGWKYEKEMDDGFLKESWESLYNEDVEFELRHLGKTSAEEAKKRIQLDEDDYKFVVQEQSDIAMIGTDPKDNDVLQVRFFTSGDNLYEVQLKYPMEATEGFGTRMQEIVNTFEPII